ncbi:hypothetical protein [Streptomyces sp. WMMB303]|uniref:hypothetical protein n=1 Tax=Streptomyces sp. WMMB303 TaxID=3034154 RepID=UPI0023EC3BF5|nr:hypothetical protein [Streptomyces sp. WMMB303]MDF4254560.1 hypothetical protein [Streptomyces sp. WMMB303]
MLDCYFLEIKGLVAKVATDEGQGAVTLQVEVPRKGRRPWERSSDKWFVEVPAGQLEAAQELYAPGAKVLRDVEEYRWVSVEIGPGHLKKVTPSVWLRRLLRKPLELGDVRRVVFEGIYEGNETW